MPDHVHWLFELGNRLSLGRVLARFKAQSRKLLLAETIEWQRDFFEHRLRAEEAVEDYALYIFLNPYRAAITREGNWPGWYTARPESLRFLSILNSDGTPPEEWLNLVPPKPLVTGE